MRWSLSSNASPIYTSEKAYSTGMEVNLSDPRQCNFLHRPTS